jgi:hypothetical protein
MKIYINKKNDDLHDVKNGYGHFYIIDYEIEIDMEQKDYIVDNNNHNYIFHCKQARKDQDDKYFDDFDTTKRNYCVTFILHILRLLRFS